MLRRLGALALLVLVAFVGVCAPVPAVASVAPPTGLKTRVWGFDLPVQGRVGVEVSPSRGPPLGYGLWYDGLASGSPVAPNRGVRAGWREALGEGPELEAMRVTDARGAGMASRPRHHVFPQEHRAFFEERGFVGERSIDTFTIELQESTHQAIHGGGNFRLGRKWAGEWNKRIMGEVTRIEREVGRPLKFEEVMSVGEDLMSRYGLEGPFVPYRR